MASTAGVSVMRGRPRKHGVARQPDGRIRPQKMAATDETLERRADALAPLIARHPYLLAKEKAKDPDAEWYIGRLRLVGLITVPQRDAARGYQEVAMKYAALLKGPKPAGALDMTHLGGSHDGEETERGTKEFRRAKRVYERHWNAVAAHGAEVLRAVAKALREEDCNLDLLRTGLDALAKVRIQG